MGCSSQKNVQTNGENNQNKNGLKSSQEINLENQDKKEQKEEVIKPQVPDSSNKNEEDNIDDMDNEADEYQKFLLWNVKDPSDKLYKYNSRGDRIKSRTKNKNKKPFIITLIEGSSYKKIKIVFNACAFIEESLMPIWCPKDAFIKFKVKGQWRIDKLYPYTDSKGLPSINKGGFNYGALIGRIGKGDDFVVYNDKVVTVKKEGPLYMRQLLPKKLKIEPEGNIEVYVFDGEYMDIDEINEKIGWIENNFDNNDINKINEIIEDNNNKIKNDDNMKKEFENKIRNEINNLRMNPLIYYEQFIRKTKNLTDMKKYLELLNNEYLGVLNLNEDYYNAISTYFELYEQNKRKKNINKNNISSYLSELEEEIEYFLINKFEIKTKVKCRLTQKTNPKDIIVQYFYDKKYRFYIFNKKSRDLTINVINNFYRNLSLIIIAFTLEPPSEIVFK